MSYSRPRYTPPPKNPPDSTKEQDELRERLCRNLEARWREEELECQDGNRRLHYPAAGRQLQRFTFVHLAFCLVWFTVVFVGVLLWGLRDGWSMGGGWSMLVVCFFYLGWEKLSQRPVQVTHHTKLLHHGEQADNTIVRKF